MSTRKDETNAIAVIPEVLTPGRAMARSLAHSDGWNNVLTGLGRHGYDKTKATKFAFDPLTYEELHDLWRGDDMAAKAVEKIPEEMLREGFSLRVRSIEGVDDPTSAGEAEMEAAEPEANGTAPQGPNINDPEASAPLGTGKGDAFGGPPQAGAPFAGAVPIQPPPKAPPGPISQGDGDAKEIEEQVTAKLQELHAEERLQEALNSERAFGGGAILVGADDETKDLRKPLDLDRIKSIRFLTVLQTRELVPVEYFSDPLAPNYGEPSIWRILPMMVPIGPSAPPADSFQSMREVHASRLIIFPGIRISRKQVQANKGWGDSVLIRMQKVLSDFGMSWGGAAILLADFAQAVMKVNGLAELIATDQDEIVLKRAATMNLTRSIARIVLIDGENEDFKRESTSLAGFPEMLDRFASRFAAAADMPVTILMGQAPAGLNATGASDIRSFYDRVASMQKKKLLPALERLIRLIFLSKDGPTNGVEPEVWGIEFNPLYQLTALEEATRRKTIAETDAIYLTNSVVTPEEIAGSRFGGDKFSAETTIDFEGRETMAADHEAAQAEFEAKSEAAAEEAKKAAGADPNAPPVGDKPGTGTTPTKPATAPAKGPLAKAKAKADAAPKKHPRRR